MLASDLGGVEGEAASDLETCKGRVKSGALPSAAVGGRISQGRGDWSPGLFGAPGKSTWADWGPRKP